MTLAPDQGRDEGEWVRDIPPGAHIRLAGNRQRMPGDGTGPDRSRFNRS